MAEQDFYASSEYQQAMTGRNGWRLLLPADDPTPASERYVAIKAMAVDSVITATAHPLHPNANVVVSETILANDVLPGYFSNINIVSGRVWAYFADDKLIT